MSLRTLVALAAVALAVAASPSRADVESPRAGGAALVRSSYVGDGGVNALRGAAYDRFGNLYLAGIGSPAPLSEAHEVVFGSEDARSFVAKIAPDGELLYVFRIGGPFDTIDAVAVDEAGECFCVGRTSSPDFPVVAPPDPLPAATGSGLYFARVAPDGRSIVSSALLGPGSLNLPARIAVTRDGSAVIGSNSRVPGWPLVNPLDAEADSHGDATVLKISADATRVVYSTYLGGDGADEIEGLAVDAAGDAYLAGYTTSRDNFPLVNPAAPVDHAAGDDGFVTKLSADGAAIVYSSIFGGENNDRATGIAVDADGSVVVAATVQDGFPVTKKLQPQAPNYDMTVVMKLDPSGSRIVYSTAMTGFNGSSTYDVGISRDGSTVVSGVSVRPTFPVVAPWQAQIADDHRHTEPSEDLTVARVSPSGGEMTFATYWGGVGADFPKALAIDAVGTATIVGDTGSNDFPLRRSLGPFGGGRVEGLFVTFAPSRPPTVSSVVFAEKAGEGLQLKISGAGFARGTNAYIDGDTAPWELVRARGSALVLKGGDALAARFPVGVAVPVRIVTAGGGGAIATVTRS